MLTKKKKIAVIGGGLSAMTAVYTLSQQPDFEQSYDITLYQLGWRLGGKGASGVNRKMGYRIEEHGLHLWMGFYENAFTMMRSCYNELGRDPGQPLATFEAAFKSQPFMIFAENIDNQWIDWQIDFPPLGGTIGDGTVATFEELIGGIFEDIKNKFKAWANGKSDHKANHLDSNTHLTIIPEGLKDWFHSVEQGALSGLEHTVEKGIVLCGELLSKLTHFVDFNFEWPIQMIKNLKKWIWDLLGEDVYKDNDARRLWYTIDLLLSIFTGFMVDKVFKIKNGRFGLDFDCINNWDYAKWLEFHGADKEITIPCPYVKSMYDGPFAFLKGDINKPDTEAGTMLRVFFRLAFTCKEDVVWRMQAAMGDTIFAPLYQCLIRRPNVKVKFFQKANKLNLSEDKKNVESIEFENQAITLGDYDPFEWVNGLPCWPSEPIYDRLDPKVARALQERAIDLETPWTDWEGCGNYTLERNVDFDEVILGASVESVKEMCAQMIEANTSWKQMADAIQTVQTQAFQWWLNQTPSELGVMDQKLLSCYAEPTDTFAEMNQLLSREAWPPEANVQYISYVCGVLDQPEIIPPYSDTDFPHREKMRVFSNLQLYIQNLVQHLLPGAYANNQFEWEKLVDLSGQMGPERLKAQYYRPNINPSERYVLSVPNSSKFRLFTHGHGFDNLFITGDWIQNGLNAGFVEGAAVSGLLTARAVSGNSSIPIVFPEWDLSDTHP